MDRQLRANFSIRKPRLKRWSIKKRTRKKRNPILQLLVGDKGTIRGLAKRCDMSTKPCWKILTGRSEPLAYNAQKIARACGISTDMFLDVLATYFPDKRVPKVRKPKESLPSPT